MPPDSHDDPPISSRKASHLQLCIEEEVGFRNKTTLLEEVELIHNALPELALKDIDCSTSFVGKRLQAPLIIAAMTGGTPQAEAINRALAQAAEVFKVGFGFGSQRPLLLGRSNDGYHVRDVAPTALILGNIGVVQARDTTSTRLKNLLDQTGADALCVHLNPAMELVQPEGDSDFTGGLETIKRLVQELNCPVIVKETGCGLSREVGEKLVEIGVHAVDVSGAGGTSWVGVEASRAVGLQASLGERFWDWGIPTAASVAQLSGLPLQICATGGIQSGLELARALALGASCCGIARPFLKAHERGQLNEAISLVLQELKVAMLLSGSRNLAELQQKPLILGPRLLRWIPKSSAIQQRIGR
jgi:isopentenyl-diphosphate delta-isomerase